MTDRLVKNIRKSARNYFKYQATLIFTPKQWSLFADKLEKYLEKNYIPKEKGMKLESLEKLRSSDFAFIVYRDCQEKGNNPMHALNEIADKIQAEINQHFLPRPEFEDGTPIQWKDKLQNGEILDSIVYREDGSIGLNAWIDDYEYYSADGGKFIKPEPPDTPDKVLEDVLLDPMNYCIIHGINLPTGSSYDESRIKATRHLLERQRRLVQGAGSC